MGGGREGGNNGSIIGTMGGWVGGSMDGWMDRSMRPIDGSIGLSDEMGSPLSSSSMLPMMPSTDKFCLDMRP